MPLEGFADPITSNGTGFRPNMPVSKLIKRVTRAIEASDVASTPPVVKTVDWATVTKTSQPLTESQPHAGAQEGWTCKETEGTVAER